METFVIKVGSKRKPLRATLSDSDGAIDLTNALTVHLVLENKRTGAMALTGVCTMETPKTSGIVRYDWSTDDVTSGVIASVSDYRAEFKITWAAGDIQRVPSDGFFAVQVIRNAEMEAG